jgi:PKD repeat protein
MNMKGVLHISFMMLAATLLVLPVSGAFAVTGINPDEGYNTGLVFITNLSGTDLPQNAGVILTRTGQSNITGQFVNWESPTRITCLLDLGGKAAGEWDVIVVNKSDGTEAILPDSGFTIKNPAPTITGITPDTGVNTGIVVISSISGTNFLPGITTRLTKSGAAPVIGTDVAFINATHLECRFNLSGISTGAWNVTINNTDGQGAVLAGGFTVTYPPPLLSGITPASGKNNEVIGITDLAGSNFRDGATVYLNKSGEADIPTINGPIITPGKILCFFDLNGARVGAWNVVVANSDGQYDSLPGAFTIYYPQAPIVTGITPATANNSGPVFISNLAGTGFQPGATVKLSKAGESDIPGSLVTVNSSSQILCSFNLTGADRGSWDVQVTNDDGQYGTFVGGFTIVYPAPTLTGITPTTGLNSGPVVIPNLSGTGFQNGAAVSLFRAGETDIVAYLVTVETPGRINCTIDLNGAKPGIWSVRVTNPDDQSAILTDAFTVKYPPPSVSAISPSSGIKGESFSANISGGNFLPGCHVNLTYPGEANIPGMVSLVTPAKITCGLDLSGAKTGLWSLTVTNPDGQEDTLASAFIIYNPAPTVASITPNTGKNNGMTDVLTIKGTGFLSATAVKLTKGGQSDIIAKGSPDVENETTITCYFDLSGAEVGSWDVVVTTSDMQSGTLPAGYAISYPAAPQITTITPNTGFNDGSVSIADLAGTGFEEGAVVVLKKSGEPDIPGTSVAVTAPDRITCDFDLTSAETGAWDVRVTNDDGQYGTLAGGFTVRYPPPTVNSIAPSIGLNNGSVLITNLSGTGFYAGASVKISKLGQADIGATSVSVVNSTKITCILNLTGAASGPWNIVVTNPDSQYDILPNAFTVEYPAPTVKAITPNKGANNGSVFISAINGTTFLPGATVQLTRSGYAPITATSVNVESMTRINCTFDLTGKVIGYWNVVVRNTDGKSGTLASGFEVTPPPPVPDFSAEPTYGTAPLTVHFKDLSTNGPEVWAWNFGDGTTSVGQEDQKNPVHTYQNPGIYNVYLRVINKGGASQITKQSYIRVVSTPIAKFTAEPVSGPAPLLVQFTDISDGNPNKWFWTFGNNGYSMEQNPYNLYEQPGTYTVKLTVYNEAGSDTVTKTDLITVISIPVAGFTANRTVGTSPFAVQFTDLSEGGPTTWFWRFGDGWNSSEQNPEHVFSSPGTYSVQLDVTNTAGNSTETKVGYITVGESLMADFDYQPSNLDNTAPLTVAFTDRSLGNPVMWTWRFGDGYVVNQRNPIHNFPTPGIFNVTLTVTGSSGSDSVTKTLTVKSPLRAEFYAEPTTGSVPLTVVLSDTSVGHPTQRKWIISKGADVTLLNSAEQNQVYTFNEPGLYTVMLRVQDEFGSVSELEKVDYINVLPFPQ